MSVYPGDFYTHNLTHDCGACWAFVSLRKINRSSSVLDGFNNCVVLLLSAFSDCFYVVLIISFTVWCNCQTFIFTGEVDADAVKPHTSDVFFESVTPAHDVE